MKKILAIAALGLVSAGLVYAANVNTPYGPFVGVDGGTLRTGSGIQFGQNPLDQSCAQVVLATAAGALNVGDAVVYGGSAGPLSVQHTSNTADPLFAGIVLTAATGSGQVVQLCQSGVVRAYVPGGATYGQLFVTKNTANGALVELVASGATITADATSAIGFRALQTVSGDYAIGRVQVR